MECYTLSLHDALPICGLEIGGSYGNTNLGASNEMGEWEAWLKAGTGDDKTDIVVIRSEEHTSELQSHSENVCRLLLEKKKLQRQQGQVSVAGRRYICL